MKRLGHLFDNNRNWAQQLAEKNPAFFEKLVDQHTPEFLWIGCSDARVPANEIVGLAPGEMFVHRNIANQIIHTDMNSLSVIQYAVEVLQVKHIIVCGHYGCGGIHAALDSKPHGLIDNWLRHVRDTIHKHQTILNAIEDPRQRRERLCELNVIEQVNNVCHTTIVQEAWAKDKPLTVHGWIYALCDGLLKDLNVCVDSPKSLTEAYRLACRQ